MSNLEKEAVNQTVAEAISDSDSKVIGSRTTSGNKKTKRVAAVDSVSNGVIGSSVKTVEIVEKEAASANQVKEETVAVYSTKNVHWDGVGRVNTGYNILSASIADKWIKARPHHVRIANPEEVAKEFGI